MVVTRFAPSPTGPLHLGHAYSALISHRFARERGGVFLLRIEDIDPGRSRPEHIGGIIEDLKWLGIAWDGEPVLQSQRLPRYAEALERLRARGLAYRCYCTRRDIAASAAAPHGPEGGLYPGTCRGLVAADEERPHAWRLDVAKALSLFPRESRGPDLGSCVRRSTLTWHDEVEGWIEADPLRFGDVVLARKDAPTSYHLAVTVDDAAQGVTDVVRGRDLFEATHVHRLLQALLELPTPRYHHHPLIADAKGKRLAKRDNAPTLASLRAAGADPWCLAEDLLAGRLPAGYSAGGA